MYFCKLVLGGNLHLRRTHLGFHYRIHNSKTYSVFRETISDKDYEGQEVTLVIGFRLLFIQSNSFLHRIFQILSILDTPIWVGFPGFRIKYWLVEQNTKDYLGLYCYKGRRNAQKYAEYITTVLRPVSVQGSVWYEIVDSIFQTYLKKHIT